MEAFEGMSQESQEIMAELGDLGPTTRSSDMNVKGYLEEGQIYLSARDLHKYSAAFKEAALWLEKRAAADKFSTK